MPQGAAATLDISLHPIRDEPGMVIYIVPEGRNSTERVQAEAARLEREARYRMVFEALDEGFCVIELHLDERDNPVDDTFVEANPAFVNQTGLVHANGRRAKEMVPTLEDHWIEIYGKVALPGEATRFQDSSVPMGRWFGVSAFRIGQPDERLVALLCTDVTAAGSDSRSVATWREAWVET